MSDVQKVIAGTERPCVICRGPRNCALNGELQTVCYECIHKGRHAIEHAKEGLGVLAAVLDAKKAGAFIPSVIEGFLAGAQQAYPESRIRLKVT